MSDRLLIAHDYQTLKQALNHRRLALKMSLLELDAKAGLSEGYAGHLLGSSRNFGELTLPLLLSALGVALALVEVPRDGRTFAVKAIRRDHYLQKRLSELGRKGGRARRASVTEAEWKELCSRGGKAASGDEEKALARVNRFRKVHGAEFPGIPESDRGLNDLIKDARRYAAFVVSLPKKSAPD